VDEDGENGDEDGEEEEGVGVQSDAGDAAWARLSGSLMQRRQRSKVVARGKRWWGSGTGCCLLICGEKELLR
jgi:hypothetical protein